MLGNDSLYHLTDRNLEEIHEVDAITGAFFFTRKSVFEKVGYFDEDYFMYAEDIDLCYRIKKAGYKIMYIPKVSVLHSKGVSSGLKKHSQNISQANLETRKRSLNYFYKTMKIFYKKHYEKSYPFFINWLVYLGINLRWFLAKRKLTV
jgi:GT2 family glycosyltransferase